MKCFRLALISLVTLPLAGCHKDKAKHQENPETPAPVVPSSKPVVSLGLQGGLAVGSVLWTLPKYLEGQFKELDRDQSEAALDIDLVKDDAKKSVHVNSGFQVKSCKPSEEVESFVKGYAVDPADNVPESLKTDMFEIGSWTSETKAFKGRIVLQKRYKSQGDTGIYRIDALIANEKSSECALWNFVFTPPAGTTAEFIEGSDGYHALIESLATTWEDLGADFEE